MMMDSGSQYLYLIMKDVDYDYCLFRVLCEPNNTDSETTIFNFGDPLFKLKVSSYPEGMSFASVGPRIFLVGGYNYCPEDVNPSRISNETFIYDTSSDSFDKGPPLVSPKAQPLLFTVGSKIFALSRFIFSSYPDNPDNPAMDPEPRFEVLDTNHLQRGWSGLPVPQLHATERKNVYLVHASTIVCIGDSTSVSIVISVKDAGVYLFDVDKMVWVYAGMNVLPFIDHAIPMARLPNFPYASSLCCSFPAKSDKFSVFHFRYENEGEENSPLLKVDEVEIDSSVLDLCPPLPPEVYFEWTVMCFDSAGRLYFVTAGIDDEDADNSGEGGCYVKVSVCKVKGHIVKRCKKKKDEDKTVKLDSNKAPLLKKCNSHMGHDHQEGEGITLGLKKGISLKSCSSKRRIELDGKGDETIEVNLAPIWRKSFFSGTICETAETVHAAFVI